MSVNTHEGEIGLEMRTYGWSFCVSRDGAVSAGGLAADRFLRGAQSVEPVAGEQL